MHDHHAAAAEHNFCILDQGFHFRIFGEIGRCNAVNRAFQPDILCTAQNEINSYRFVGLRLFFGDVEVFIPKFHPRDSARWKPVGHSESEDSGSTSLVDDMPREGGYFIEYPFFPIEIKSGRAEECDEIIG